MKKSLILSLFALLALNGAVNAAAPAAYNVTFNKKDVTATFESNNNRTLVDATKFATEDFLRDKGPLEQLLRLGFWPVLKTAQYTDIVLLFSASMVVKSVGLVGLGTANVAQYGLNKFQRSQTAQFLLGLTILIILVEAADRNHLLYPIVDQYWDYIKALSFYAKDQSIIMTKSLQKDALSSMTPAGRTALIQKLRLEVSTWLGYFSKIIKPATFSSFWTKTNTTALPKMPTIQTKTGWSFPIANGLYKMAFTAK